MNPLRHNQTGDPRWDVAGFRAAIGCAIVRNHATTSESGPKGPQLSDRCRRTSSTSSSVSDAANLGEAVGLTESVSRVFSPGVSHGGVAAAVGKRAPLGCGSASLG